MIVWIKKYGARLLLLLCLSSTAIPFEAIAGSLGNRPVIRERSFPGSAGEAPLLSVQEAKDMLGQPVTVQGVVVKDQVRIRGGKRSVHIQDGTGGIHVFDYRGPDVKAGHVIRVTGAVADHQGLLEIRSTEAPIQVLHQDKPVPLPIKLSIMDLKDAGRVEALKGKLVRLQGRLKELPPAVSNGVCRIPLVDSAGNGITLIGMEGVVDLAGLRPGITYEIAGVLSQYETYEIIPQSSSDIVEVHS